MRIGYYTDFSETEVKWAAKQGFRSLELSGWPGDALDPMTVTDDQIAKVREVLGEHDVQCSAIGYYPNHLDPNAEARRDANERLLKLCEVAQKMGCGVIATFAGMDPSQSIPDNMPLFREVWTPIVKKAQSLGIKIAFENCAGHNLAFKPEAWDLMFDAFPDGTLGLEFDPSHLVFLHNDYLMLAREYGSHIHHVHAKDTEILHHRLAKEGIRGHGWWRFRVPGWGCVDWQQFIAILHDAGYQNNIDIEHEDPVFHGERYREGLILGYKHLSQFVA